MKFIKTLYTDLFLISLFFTFPLIGMNREIDNQVNSNNNSSSTVKKYAGIAKSFLISLWPTSNEPVDRKEEKAANTAETLSFLKEQEILNQNISVLEHQRNLMLALLKNTNTTCETGQQNNPISISNTMNDTENEDYSDSPIENLLESNITSSRTSEIQDNCSLFATQQERLLRSTIRPQENEKIMEIIEIIIQKTGKAFCDPSNEQSTQENLTPRERYIAFFTKHFDEKISNLREAYTSSFTRKIQSLIDTTTSADELNTRYNAITRFMMKHNDKLTLYGKRALFILCTAIIFQIAWYPAMTLLGTATGTPFFNSIAFIPGAMWRGFSYLMSSSCLPCLPCPKGPAFYTSYLNSVFNSLLKAININNSINLQALFTSLGSPFTECISKMKDSNIDIDALSNCISNKVLSIMGHATK